MSVETDLETVQNEMLNVIAKLDDCSMDVEELQNEVQRVAAGVLQLARSLKPVSYQERFAAPQVEFSGGVEIDTEALGNALERGLDSMARDLGDSLERGLGAIEVAVKGLER